MTGTWGSREAAAEWMSVTAARNRMLGPVTEQMLDLIKLGAGSRVLDIGAGAGDTALAVAQRVGPTGHVLAADISATMLEMAAAAARQAGLSNIETRVMDAQKLDLTSESFDAVVSRFALMLIPDIGTALAEIWRVLRPGGTVAALVFSTPDKDPYLSIPHDVARRVGRLTSTPEPFGEFRLGGPGVLSAAYARAGFDNVVIHPVSIRRRFPSLHDAVSYAKVTPLPLRELMVQLNPRQQEQAWAEIERAFQQFVTPAGFDSLCEILVGVGTK